MKILYYLIITVSYCCISFADTDEQLRLKKATPWQLNSASNIFTTYRNPRSGEIINQKDNAFKLANARVLIADYDLIRLDFTNTKDFTNSEIDQWILDHFGYIAQDQVKPNEVNTPIAINADQSRIVSRPEGYGRGFRMSYNLDMLVDAKGVGAKKPVQAEHRNGLMTLGEALREYTFEGIVSDILYTTKSNWRTVGSYAVIDPGFNVIHADGSQSRAGIYLRQGVKRLYNSYIGGDDRLYLINLLKKFGISLEENLQGTSVNVSGSQYGDYVIDFGHYVIDPDFATKISLPLHVWGPAPGAKKIKGEKWSLSKQDIPWNTYHNLAEQFASDKANRHNIWETHRYFINSFRQNIDQLNILEINPSCNASLMKESPPLELLP